MIRIFFLVGTLLATLEGFANDPPLGGWLMYFGSTKIENTKFNLNYDLQYRNHELVGDLNQMVVRGSLQYAVLDNLTVGAGYAFVHTEQFEKPDLPFMENRIFQDVLTQQKLANNILKHRFRFEQRFIENHDLKMRLRYQLGLDVPVYHNSDKNQSVYATMYNELFMNLDEPSRKTNAFDRNRLYVGAGFKMNNALSFQLGWMNQMLQKQSYQQLMFSIHHNLKW